MIYQSDAGFAHNDILNLGYELVSGVSINEDWSAMRFRKVEHIKKMVRLAAGTLTDAGKKRTADNKGPPGWAERAAAKKARDEAKAKTKAEGKPPASTAKAKTPKVVTEVEKAASTTKNRGKPASAAETDNGVKPAASKRTRSDPVVVTQEEPTPSTNRKRRRV